MEGEGTAPSPGAGFPWPLPFLPLHRGPLFRSAEPLSPRYVAHPKAPPSARGFLRREPPKTTFSLPTLCRNPTFVACSVSWHLTSSPLLRPPRQWEKGLPYELLAHLLVALQDVQDAVLRSQQRPLLLEGQAGQEPAGLVVALGGLIGQPGDRAALALTARKRKDSGEQRLSEKDTHARTRFLRGVSQPHGFPAPAPYNIQLCQDKVCVCV